MTFQQFWPTYLRAHRLPGTRALHYFATALGVLAAMEALVDREPWIGLAGIAIAYAITAGAHWFVEGNQPTLRGNPLWLGIAELRMCWLALSGRLDRELAKLEQAGGAPHGTDSGSHLTRAGSAGGRILLAVSATGLAAGMFDLGDLANSMEAIAHPAIQLGTPVIAFAAALLTAAIAHRGARRMALAEGDTAPNQANGRSLRRASLALVVFGLTAFGVAEALEHGALTDGLDPAILLIALLFMSLLSLLWHAGGNGADMTGPSTLGLRVDGRAELVDALENLLSFGRRRRILEATLDAAELGAGEWLVDVGCGTGELAMRAATMGGRAMGIDATPDMIAMARRRAAASQPCPLRRGGR